MNTPEEIKRLEESEIYMALVGKDYLLNASCLAQWEHARTLKKPFLILTTSNIEIPDDMLQNVNILKMIDIDTTKPQDVDKDLMVIMRNAFDDTLNRLKND